MNFTNISILLVAGLLGGCAATIPTELASARHAYDQANAGPAAKLVPAELHKAHEALGEAEAAFKDDPRGYHTKDLAYVAQRKAELAEALAANASAQSNTAAANSAYQTTQDAIMKDTKAQLGATRTDLATTQTVAAQTQAQLDAAKASGAQTQAQLAASETARAAAEARANDAMAALAKLAAVKEETRGMVITLSGSVLFRSDEATLLTEAQTRLGQVTDALLATKERTILVEGHTDSQGSDSHNLDLSQRRADAVRAFLMQRGYDGTRIRAVGIGEARPLADNATAEGRANNRRVEIVVEPLKAATNWPFQPPEPSSLETPLDPREDPVPLIVSRTLALLGEIAERHVELAKQELGRDAAALGSNVVLLALAAPLLGTGYAFLCAAGAISLGNWLGTCGGLVVIGAANVILGGMVGARGVARLRGFRLLHETVAELQLTAHALGPTTPASAGRIDEVALG